MPESATLEAPSEVTVSTDPIPGNEMPEGLRNLLDRVLPSESGSDTGEQIEADDPPTEEKPETEEKTPAKVEEKKAVHVQPDPASRLAPDLTIKPGEKSGLEEHAVTDAELKELDTLIEGAKSEKQKVDLRKFRVLLQNTISENATLKAKPAAPAEDTGQQAMIEKLRTQNHELLARIERVDLAASPKFQRDFVQPRNKLFAEAKTVLKDAGADPEALDQAMGLMGKARIDAFDAIVESIPSQTLRDRFGRLIDGVDAKNREINEALGNARKNSEQNKKQEMIANHEAILKQEAELKTALAIARRDLAENAKIPVLQKTGDPNYAWWDKIVDEVDVTAEFFMLKATPEMLPKIAYGAAMVDPLLDMFHSERKARLAAEKRLAAIEGAEPGLGEDKRKPKDSEVSDDADIKTAVFARLRSGS